MKSQKQKQTDGNTMQIVISPHKSLSRTENFSFNNESESLNLLTTDQAVDANTYSISQANNNQEDMTLVEADLHIESEPVDTQGLVDAIAGKGGSRSGPGER